MTITQSQIEQRARANAEVEARRQLQAEHDVKVRQERAEWQQRDGAYRAAIVAAREQRQALSESEERTRRDALARQAGVLMAELWVLDSQLRAKDAEILASVNGPAAMAQVWPSQVAQDLAPHVSMQADIPGSDVPARWGRFMARLVPHLSLEDDRAAVHTGVHTEFFLNI